VQKHLQTVYDKLGVESRTAAVMRTIPRVTAAQSDQADPS
jgi:DNA-binding NarL/FixJ family response regulator